MGLIVSKGLNENDKSFLQEVVRLLTDLKSRARLAVERQKTETFSHGLIDDRLQVYNKLILEHIHQCITEYTKMSHNQLEREIGNFQKLVNQFELAIQWVLHGNTNKGRVSTSTRGKRSRSV